MTTLKLGSVAAFRIADGRADLERLFDLDGAPAKAPARLRGLALLATSLGRHEDAALVLRDHRADTAGAHFVWDIAGGALRLESEWEADADTGVLRRRDRLTNTGAAPVTVFRFLARFTLAPGRHEVYAQNSRWCNENQGAWVPLHTGSLTLASDWGRSTENGTPYAAVRDVGGARGLAVHVVPRGNWVLRASARAVGNQWPCAVIEAGLADEDLRWPLAPGETLEGPDLLLQALPGGEPHLAAPALHAWVNARLPAPDKAEIPVLYNTWFDRFSDLEVPRLRDQLQAARDVGCEVFVVDAGWFGPEDIGWKPVGDWREKTGAAFGGRMREFADEVCAAGLGFGLWMEPERAVANTPVARDHPDWFAPGLTRFRLDLPAARAYLRGEMRRLIETYGLAWFKLDFNAGLGHDADGFELARYDDAWRGMLDDLRRDFPATVFENCSSGGLRLDLASLRHYDVHFPTDTANPIDVLRISQGAWLRLPPGRILRWATLRGAGLTAPTHGARGAAESERLITPGGATWNMAELADLDFIAAAALPGILGYSGDLASLPPAGRARLRWFTEFYQQRRRRIRGSVAHLLTPPRPLADRAGWTAVQLQSPDTGASLLFAYHLPNDGVEQRRFPLRGLDPARAYRVRQTGPDGDTVLAAAASGAALMGDGVALRDPWRQQARWHALIAEIDPA